VYSIAFGDFFPELPGDHQRDARHAAVGPLGSTVQLASMGRFLNNAGKDGSGFGGIGPALAAPGRRLVGLNFHGVVAAVVHANPGGDDVGKHGFEHFLQRVAAFDFRELP
jgi:hypothetical protein